MRLDRDTGTQGGIEGLPLQLMIIILVATMGAAILVGWMGSIETPHTISGVDVDPPYVTETDGAVSGDITITVTDQDGNYIEGAGVKLVNLGVRMIEDTEPKVPFLVTDEDGRVTFSNLTVSGTGTIGIEVTKSGYTENTTATITVYR